MSATAHFPGKLRLLAWAALFSGLLLSLAAPLLDVRAAIEQAEWRFAFDGRFPNDPLISILLWHFSPWELGRLYREKTLAPGDILEPGVYDEVIVVMADLCSFSSYVRDTRDPAVTRRWLTQFYSLARHAVLNAGGMLYQFVGDEVIGFTENRGSHAEFVAVPAQNLTAKPATVSWDVAGGLYVAGTTAYAAVRSIDLAPGDVVAVSGAAGGVGSIGVQLAAVAGATGTNEYRLLLRGAGLNRIHRFLFELRDAPGAGAREDRDAPVDVGDGGGADFLFFALVEGVELAIGAEDEDTVDTGCNLAVEKPAQPRQGAGEKMLQAALALLRPSGGDVPDHSEGDKRRCHHKGEAEICGRT